MTAEHYRPDDIDRRIIAATQGGLPLVTQPYRVIAEDLGLAPELVMARMQRMLERGAIRRNGLVPNHYALGVTANGMSVWIIEEDRIRDAGRLVGGLDYVSHCYHRPSYPPEWPYTLFAMVHGRDRAEVESKVAEIADLLGTMQSGHDVLYSTRILKKTGLRIAA